MRCPAADPPGIFDLGLTCLVVVMVAIVLHMIHGATITLSEAFAKLVASCSLVRRVLVHLMVIGIGVTMLAVVMPGCFNALVKTALLNIAVVSGSSVPTVVVLVLRRRGCRLRFVRAGFECAGRCDAESKQGWCDPFYVLHRI